MRKFKLFIKKHWKDIMLIISFLVIVLFLCLNSCTNKKLNVAETNIKALKDTIKCYELKNGDLLYEKQGYILKIGELEEYIAISKKEAKELEQKLKSSISTIALLEARIAAKDIHTTDTIYRDKTDTTIYNIKFDYEDEWLMVNGITRLQYPTYANTTLTNISMDVPIVIGTTSDDKWFVTSKNPYVSFTKIEGANIEKSKPKRFSIGVQCGVGPSFGYGILENNSTLTSGLYFGVGVYVGIGFTYKLVDF